MSSCKTYGRKLKKRHESKAAAYEHLEKHYAMGSNGIHKMQVYRCPLCRYWHIGRIPRPHKTKNPNYDVILVGKLIGILRGTYNYADDALTDLVSPEPVSDTSAVKSAKKPAQGPTGDTK